LNPTKTEDKLALNKYDVDKEVHIRIKEEKCNDCLERSCLYVCPAACFKPVEDHITFSYEGCLECGSCRIACDREAIEWTLPRAGFGICYQYG
jgi:ferredoxin like protein